MNFWQEWVCLMRCIPIGRMVIQSKSIKQFCIEKTNCGNSHEIHILDVGECLFLLWKKERNALCKGNSAQIVALWIGKGEPAKPAMMVRCLQKLLKDFNPCLQMHKLDLRRLKISPLFQKREENTNTQWNCWILN
jgi:hypothetical protein